MPIVFSAEALEDLTAIRAYIALDSPIAASRVAVQIVAACDRLEVMPERGRPGLVPGTRELASAWPYVIVYRIAEDAIQIIRIWHGAQDR
jgi:plasmid stabilization system protein ParE